MPAAARSLQGYKAKSFRQTKFELQTELLTYLLTEWFIELHVAAKKDILSTGAKLLTNTENETEKQTNKQTKIINI